jgi:hypothetical protein
MEIVKEASKNLADAYYQAVGNKDLPTIANLLHTDVRLIGPLGHWIRNSSQEPASEGQFWL